MIFSLLHDAVYAFTAHILMPLRYAADLRARRRLFRRCHAAPLMSC